MSASFCSNPSSTPFSASSVRFCSQFLTPSIWLCIFDNKVSLDISVPALNSSNIFIWESRLFCTLSCIVRTAFVTSVANVCCACERLLNASSCCPAVSMLKLAAACCCSTASVLVLTASVLASVASVLFSAATVLLSIYSVYVLISSCASLTESFNFFWASSCSPFFSVRTCSSSAIFIQASDTVINAPLYSIWASDVS